LAEFSTFLNTEKIIRNFVEQFLGNPSKKIEHENLKIEEGNLLNFFIVNFRANLLVNSRPSQTILPFPGLVFIHDKIQFLMGELSCPIFIITIGLMMGSFY
jgi:hypothetical protein